MQLNKTKAGMILVLKRTLLQKGKVINCEVAAFDDHEHCELWACYWYLSKDQYSILEDHGSYNDIDENGCGFFYELDAQYLNTSMTKEELKHA
jgi:hypothetical protein